MLCGCKPGLLWVFQLAWGPFLRDVAKPMRQDDSLYVTTHRLCAYAYIHIHACVSKFRQNWILEVVPLFTCADAMTCMNALCSSRNRFSNSCERRSTIRFHSSSLSFRWDYKRKILTRCTSTRFYMQTYNICLAEPNEFTFVWYLWYSM